MAGGDMVQRSYSGTVLDQKLLSCSLAALPCLVDIDGISANCLTSVLKG